MDGSILSLQDTIDGNHLSLTWFSAPSRKLPVINKYTPSLKYFGLLYLGIEGLIFSEFEIYNGVKLIQLEDIKSLILLCMFMSIGADVIIYNLKKRSEIRKC